MRQLALIGAIFVVGGNAEAIAAQMNDEELRTAVSGKTVTIDTPLGLPITVNYSANGLMTGSAGLALGAYLGAQKDRGRWRIENGKLCTKWFKWLGSDASCMTLRQDGLKIYWQSDDGQSGTASIEPGPPVLAGQSASALGVPVVAAAMAKPKSEAVQAGSGAVEQAEAHQTQAKAVEPEPRIDAGGAWREGTTTARSAHHSTKFVLASLAPGHISQPQPAPPLAAAGISGDPFEREAQPMRLAADMAAISAMEHRWCHANALADGRPPQAVKSSAIGLAAAPSLLAIAEEQAYDGELPLHQASCLTEEPAIAIMDRLRAQVARR